MQQLLASLGRKWDTSAYDLPVITLQQNTGIHTMVTVSDAQIHFHSTAFKQDMPVQQSIVLSDYTLQELVNTISGMGYSAVITSEAVSSGLSAKKAFVLLPTENILISGAPTKLTAFTSKLWQMVYPIARILSEVGENTDDALTQRYAASSTGRWADYWASFFNLQRLQGESDSELSQRVFAKITSTKTNNVAIAELIRAELNTAIQIIDVDPGIFEVLIDPTYMNADSLSRVHAVTSDAKAGGIAYIINFFRVFSEEFKAYYSSTHDTEFKDSDVMSCNAQMSMVENRYGHAQDGVQGFIIGSSVLDARGSTSIIMSQPAGLMADNCTITLTQGGTTLRSESY